MARNAVRVGCRGQTIIAPLGDGAIGAQAG
jgi:hypothetical protein